jgi:anti-anti-sigma factor
VYVLVLRGRRELGEESSRFPTTVDTLLSNGATRIVVSLYDVKFIDTGGLGSLIDALQGSKARGGLLKLASPSAKLVQILQSSDLQGMFEIFPTEGTATQSFWSNCAMSLTGADYNVKLDGPNEWLSMATGALR